MEEILDFFTNPLHEWRWPVTKVFAGILLLGVFSPVIYFEFLSLRNKLKKK